MLDLRKNSLKSEDNTETKKINSSPSAEDIDLNKIINP
jgi:hypothetical protein